MSRLTRAMLLLPISNAASVSTFLIVLFLISSMASIIGHDNRSLHEELQRLSGGLGPMLRADADATARASVDFGRLTRAVPAAVFYPTSGFDVATLVRTLYNSSDDDVRHFRIAARGNGHSVRGQSLAPGGVVVEMSSLGGGHRGRISVFRGAPRSYVDAGGEQLWIDVLQEALKHGVAPRSWTDYLYLTVGGTLSNAGISGQSFLHGPQISNVYELDVITGKGEVVTCSEHQEPDLFFAVLGGLGQFGIITRARIAVDPAPKMVTWLRLIYTDFKSFTRDQERLISLEGGRRRGIGFDYVEGSLLMEHGLTNNWRSSFYADEDIARIRRLAARHGAVYCLEAARYYDHAVTASSSIDQELEQLLEGMSFVPGFRFRNDVTYLNFLNRVREGELKLRARGLWEVPHPWLNVLVPRSRILDFSRGVFNRILLQHNHSVGPILIYPMNRNKWDDRTSAVVPDEEVFYSIGLLRCGLEEWEHLEQENREILQFCDQSGIKYKQYLPHHTSPGDWTKHFGPKWHDFVERKRRYDPKALLSPGQRIFASSLLQRSTM